MNYKEKEKIIMSVLSGQMDLYGGWTEDTDLKEVIDTEIEWMHCALEGISTFSHCEDDLTSDFSKKLYRVIDATAHGLSLLLEHINEFEKLDKTSWILKDTDESVKTMLKA